MIELLIAILALLIIAGIGFPLGVSLLFVGYVGFALVHPRGFDAAGTVAGQQILELAANHQFAVLPLFILMGVLVTRSGISDSMYDCAAKWLGHLRGGLALSTVAACGGMAAISGSSLATAATMTKVAIPAMRKYKYDDAFSAGTVAAGGTIGILIPPSGALIIYGLLAEVDIARLFIAGLIPGLISILLYFVAIQVVCIIKPDWGPRGENQPLREKIFALKDIWSVLTLFGVIMGGIFFGVFTASEGGGVGAGGALLIAVMRRKMSWSTLFESLLEAGKLTATVFAVGFGALMLNQFVNMAGAPQEILAFITQLGIGPWGTVMVILGCYVVLGMIVDGPAMIFLTVPIFVPLIADLPLPIDPELKLVWWGIIVVVAVEISLITPPIGMNVFVIASMVPDVSLMQIYRGIIAFFIADLARLALFVFAPGSVLWLVSYLG
ncbi:TRAP transporter large permease [Ruegeria atlantica]|uniref:TRAP transporter large permease n=1 Tax=Ruegeria atlantica TaxID=81569 RepID=UPI0024949899|nr:TRAP transporter large permease [Ruegeria atlantica]